MRLPAGLLHRGAARSLAVLGRFPALGGVRGTVMEAMRRVSGRLSVVFYPSFVCNYQCPYCVITTRSRRQDDYPRRDEHLWQEWAGALDRLPRAHVAISGGETLHYPGMVDLIDALGAQHAVSLTTNLSHLPAALLSSARRRRPSITASFHPSHANYGVFAANVRALCGAGLPVTVELVACPGSLAELPALRSRLARELRVPVGVDPYIGPDQCFTPGEVAALRALGVRRRSFGFDHQGAGVPKRCQAGRRHLVLVPNGDAWACHAGFYYATSPLHAAYRVPAADFLLGNLLAGTLRLERAGRRCTLPCSEACDLEGALVRRAGGTS